MARKMHDVVPNAIAEPGCHPVTSQERRDIPMNPVQTKELLETKAGTGPIDYRKILASSSWMQYVLALGFCFWALYGVAGTEVIDTDAARHAMNGAFIYDLVRTGHLGNPIEYARQYFGHLPALSMPYHPPLFPACEAVFYALFGLNLLTARIAVAVSVGICVILLYRLTLRTLGVPLMAACVCVTTFSLWTVQLVGRDVMLEFPSMVFTLGALCCLADL